MSHFPERIRCLIVGSGPAGYTAAIYAARAGLAPVVYSGGQPGGQLTTTTEVDNFPGYPQGVDGTRLMDDLRLQAERFGAEVRFGTVSEADLSRRPFALTVDDTYRIEAQALIVATGATAKYLGLPSEARLRGGGVSACATCDGFFYRGRDVAVVGGGDTACEEALYLVGLCRKVYMIVRRDVLRASKAMQRRVFDAPNIEMVWEAQVREVLGEEAVTGVRLATRAGERTITVDGLFLAIGHHPNSELFAKWLETDANGYIKTLAGTARTAVAGVFACGDVQDPLYRQAITAAASGCKAAIDAERFLSENDPKA